LMLPKDNFVFGFNKNPKCAWHDPKFVFGHHPSFSRNMDWAKGRQGKKDAGSTKCNRDQLLI
jgi:hypothetical protein